MSVRIARVVSSHPTFELNQADASRELARRGADPRRAAALARGSRIETRRLALSPAELAILTTVGERNEKYRELAPDLAVEVAGGAIAGSDVTNVGAVVTSSCTGCLLPGWGPQVIEALHLPLDCARLPITEAGCAGGVVALARAADFVAGRPGRRALVAAVELCSLSFHAGGDDDNLVASTIFGDGAGAALLDGEADPGLAIVDSASLLIPATEHAIRFDLRDDGFHAVLDRDLANLVAPAAACAATALLARQGLACADVGAWLIHPGGPAILDAIGRRVSAAPDQLRWSWESLRAFGNTSSAAIFDVMARYLAEPAPSGWAVAAAFGPGVAIELLLLRRCD